MVAVRASLTTVGERQRILIEIKATDYFLDFHCRLDGTFQFGLL